MEGWISQIDIDRLNDCFHVQRSVHVPWPRQDLQESTITIVVVRRTPLGPEIAFRGNIRTIDTSMAMVVEAGHAIATIRRTHNKRLSVELELETVRTSDIRRRHRRHRFEKVAVTTGKIAEDTSGIAEFVTNMAAGATTQMIRRRDAITWSVTGVIEIHRRHDLSTAEDLRKSTVLGIAAIITDRHRTATDRTIRNHTRDRLETGKTRDDGRSRTAGSTTRIVPTGSTRTSVSSGIMTTIPEVTPTTTVDVPEDAGKVPTRTKALTGTEANPRKIWTLAAPDINLPDDSAIFQTAEECSVGTPTRDRRCTITNASWIAAVAIWTGEDAVAALDHPTDTASTVLSRTWPTSRCSSTSTNITIQ